MSTPTIETVELSKLTPHPRNYREHPPEQIAHIAQSIKDNGFYRNVVVAKDYTILAGHGSVMAAKDVGLDKVPVAHLDIDPFSTAALKILAGDNEVQRLGIVDDKLLAEILQGIVEDGEEGLLGTGFDDDQFQFVVDVADGNVVEAGSVDPYEEWAGMPAYEHSDPGVRRIVVHFKSDEAVAEFAEIMGQKLTEKTKFIWHPAEKPETMVDKRYTSES